jgi:tetratricopeptide (TPR) repeat protein
VRNTIIVVFCGILLGLIANPLPHSFAYTQEEAIWQLVVISSEPACSGYHYYMVEKYNEITREYLDLYKLFHDSYQPECFTEDDFIEEYSKPYDLDLLILVFDKEKGMTDLHTYNTGGVYIHQGNDLSTNHNIIICDCPNFKYSDPVWILSHELSHFVLNYLDFDLDEVDEKIHAIDYKFDRCVEGEYNSLCSTIKTKIETSRASWTVMIPYESAIGIDPPTPLVQKVSLESPYQSSMIKEITNWWLDGEISDENYIKSLKILSGIVDDKKLIPQGVFENSALLLLTEPRNDYQNKTLYKDDSNKIMENFLEVNLSITKNQTYFSASEEKIFLEELQIRASTWRENKINDYEFLSDIANVLDSPNPSLFLKYLENLSFKELISKAAEYQQSGEYRNALSFYDQALLTSIDSDEMKITALIGKGSVLNAMGEYDDAIQHYDLALEMEPDNLDLLKKKAFTLAQLGLLDEAREYFELTKQMS